MLENKGNDCFWLFGDDYVDSTTTFKDLVEKWKLSGRSCKIYCQGKSVFMTHKEAIEYSHRDEPKEEIERILSIYMERDSYFDSEKYWWGVDMVEKQLTEEDLM